MHYLIKNKACKLDIEKIYFDVEGLYGRSPLLQKRREERELMRGLVARRPGGRCARDHGHWEYYARLSEGEARCPPEDVRLAGTPVV